MTTFNEAELRALSRRELQQLCKRDDVCSWRRIKANTKVSQHSASTELNDSCVDAGWMAVYSLLMPVSSALCVCLYGTRQSNALVEQLAEYFSTVVAPPSAACTAAVCTSVECEDSEDGEIYFNVSVVRSGHSEHSDSASQSASDETDMNGGSLGSAGCGGNSGCVGSGRLSAAVPLSAPVKAASTGRKRKAGEQSAGSTEAAVGSGTTTRVVHSAMSAGAKRLRVSSTSKAVSRVRSIDDQHRARAAVSMKRNLMPAVSTVSGTVNTQPSTAQPSTALAMPLPAGTSEAVQPSISLPTPPLVHNSAYAAMMAELDERVAARTGEPVQTTARPAALPTPVPSIGRATTASWKNPTSALSQPPADVRTIHPHC